MWGWLTGYGVNLNRPQPYLKSDRKLGIYCEKSLKKHSALFPQKIKENAYRKKNMVIVYTMVNPI